MRGVPKQLRLKIMKRCTRCGKFKRKQAFEDRKDAWSQWSWCNSCRILEGRDKIPQETKNFMEKTDIFILKD